MTPMVKPARAEGRSGPKDAAVSSWEETMRSILRLSLATLALIMGAASALAQQYPNKPIRLIVPYPAGGATDVVARLVSERMSEDLGQQIFVENRPGAGTMIGASGAARSPATATPCCGVTQARTRSIQRSTERSSLTIPRRTFRRCVAPDACR